MDAGLLRDLISLFDDDDPVVSDCVDRRVMDEGPSILLQLGQCLDSESDPSRRVALMERLERYNIEFRMSGLRELVAQGDSFSLFEGAFLVSALFDRRLKRDAFEREFLNLSSMYMSEASDDRTAVENIRIFNHIFFYRLHFEIVDALMKGEEGTRLFDVMAGRRGNPIAVALVYMMMAQTAGLPVRPACFNGGFVLTYEENGTVLFYINVFAKGEIFLADDLKRMLTGLPVNIEVSDVLVRRDSVMLTIYLEMLQYVASFSMQSDDDRTKRRASRIDRLASDAFEVFGNERFLSMDVEED